MENSKIGEQTPEEIFNNKKLFSAKIHARVLKVTDDITKSFDNLNIVNDKQKKLFLNAVNHYFRDLCAVIFHLRQVVIKIDVDDQGVRDIQNVITELNKIVLRVQESLNLNVENLKIQLKSTVADVGSQVENLMKIIEYDNLHEHKQKILDCQHDLCIAAEALKLFCQYSYLSAAELEGLVHEMIDKIKNSLIQIKTGHEVLATDFSHYIRHSIQNLQNILNYMRKVINTENFGNDITDVFKKAELCCIEYLQNILEAVRYDNPMNKMLDIIENCHKNIIQTFVQIQAEFQAAKLKEDERVTQLIIYMFINGINGMSALNQSIIDAIMKK